MRCVACVNMRLKKMRANALHFWINHFLSFAKWKLYISFVCLILVFYPTFGIDVRHVSVCSSLGRNKYSNVAMELQNIQVEVASELVASFFPPCLVYMKTWQLAIKGRVPRSKMMLWVVCVCVREKVLSEIPTLVSLRNVHYVLWNWNYVVQVICVCVCVRVRVCVCKEALSKMQTCSLKLNLPPVCSMYVSVYVYI